MSGTKQAQSTVELQEKAHQAFSALLELMWLEHVSYRSDQEGKYSLAGDELAMVCGGYILETLGYLARQLKKPVSGPDDLLGYIEHELSERLQQCGVSVVWGYQSDAFETARSLCVRRTNGAAS